MCGQDLSQVEGSLKGRWTLGSCQSLEDTTGVLFEFDKQIGILSVEVMLVNS